ncbi:hypothetical protein SmJEL517_g04422 [Synchytrium microbalum]|uniref:Major facilitator superfamily (MFS) profile domain-containing protein n=1 Tax=Synchytrium microbalum TaxID=1806994 RepID=A0A507BZW8_9FUNG|nr:uncharacterized protein SmJEL517_g04422 [Synchytrium microbalum]TPX32399.1 hypothetical protein SmJEL517_g04422 [Synchytrium microbalum]
MSSRRRSTISSILPAGFQPSLPSELEPQSVGPLDVLEIDLGLQKIPVSPTDTLTFKWKEDPHVALDLADENRIHNRKNVIPILIGFGFVIFLSALDTTIVTTCLPVIASELGDLSKLSWVGTSFSLTSTATVPIISKLSDFFGRKNTLFASILIFLVGSALCGAAVNIDMLIIFRAVQGVGAGGLLNLTLVSISEIVSQRERGKYQGILSACVAVSLLLGPVIGGLFTTYISWRWAFYVNLVIGIIPVAILYHFLRLPAPKGATMDKLKRIDYLGSITLFLCCVCFLLAVSWGGHEYAWISGVVLGCFAASIVLLAVFIYIEAKVAHEPIIPLHLFWYKNYAWNCLAGFAFGFVFYGTQYVFPQYFEIARGLNATDAGIRSFAMVIPFLFVSTTVGVLITVTGRYVEFFKAGSLVAIIGLYLISRWDLTTSIGVQIAFFVIFGIGAGPVNSPQSLIAQTAAKENELSVATASQSFLRTIGGTVGIAVLNAIMQSVWYSKLTGILTENGQGNLASTLFVDGSFNTNVINGLDPQTKQWVLEAFVLGFEYALWVATGAMAVCFLASMCLKHVPLRTEVKSAVAVVPNDEELTLKDMPVDPRATPV